MRNTKNRHLKKEKRKKEIDLYLVSLIFERNNAQILVPVMTTFVRLYP